MIYQIYNKDAKNIDEADVLKLINDRIKEIYNIPIDKLLLKDILTTKIHELFLEDDMLSTKARPDLDEIDIETEV